MGGLLDGTRANGAFLIRSVFDPPWSLRIRDEAPLSVAVVVSGQAWVVADDEPAVLLGPGDVLLAHGPDHYTVADAPGTSPQVFIDPGGVCLDASGRSLTEELLFDPATRSWGNDPAGRDVLVTGTYETATAVSERLLLALPPRLVLRRADWSADLVDLLCAEVQRDAPGQDVFLDRLLDLVVLGVVRAWLASAEHEAPGWYRAASDPVVGEALRLVQQRPADPWTVESLARATGTSRSAFARRFSEVVGESPMAHLTSWRLALAADLLDRTDATIGSIARQVGYSTPFALSAAFSRVRGISPAQHRAARRAVSASATAGLAR
ncbi:AraC family transcriptional regulator [Aeromicrobium sp. Root495]|uniref:AraC family transcriptional regulator n=1 Tax=Aeromicrobium sp. Root495 TaxID=1736550 RepID=UPI000B24866A|nr:AraC family transcriptional regulator [Aeromicrobium sp. Root495]